MFRHLWLIALLTFNGLPPEAAAQGWSAAEMSRDGSMFALGFASGLGAHELGHYVVATSKGYKVSHDRFSIIYPNAAFTDAEHLQVASAGFQTQWIMAELALRDHDGKELQQSPGNFRAGVVCAHLGITLAYLTVLKNNKQGDVAGMAQASKRSNDNIAMVLAVPAALDAWRLFGSQVPAWVPQLSLLGKGLTLGWIWSY